MPKLHVVLHFKLHQLRIGRREIILLPRLTLRQMAFVARFLEGRGCSVTSRNPIAARSREGSIRITMSGLCCSTYDASDLVLPALPDLLAFRKEAVSPDELESMYFKGFRTGKVAVFRMALRMEHSSAWDDLRREGQSALAPDERLACTFLMKAASHCELMTDFPCYDTEPVVLGRRRYFDSTLDSREAISTLRSVDATGSRNSYLKRDGTLQLAGFARQGRGALVDLFVEMGDWCYFSPAESESSNWRHGRPPSAPVV